MPARPTYLCCTLETSRRSIAMLQEIYTWLLWIHCIFSSPPDPGESIYSRLCPSDHYDLCIITWSGSCWGDPLMASFKPLHVWPGRQRISLSPAGFLWSSSPRPCEEVKTSVDGDEAMSNIKFILKVNRPRTLYKGSGHNPEQICQADRSAQPR